MPYISKQFNKRARLRGGDPALTAGELNYQIFYFIKHNYHSILCEDNKNSNKIIKGFVLSYISLFLGINPNYQRYNDMTGCLVRCYKEIKRRLGIDVKKIFIEIMESYDDEIDKYEDKKIIYYGDIE